MKFKYLVAMAAAAMVMTNCSEEENLVKEESSGLSQITATVEGQDARSTTNDAGTFKWSVGDQLKVLTNGEYGYYKYGEDTKFTFESGTQISAESSYAMYPAVTFEVGSDGEVNKISYPAQYGSASVAYTPNTNAVMLAEVNPNNPSVLNFKHLGGVMRFTIQDVPRYCTKFTFTANGKRISGDFLSSDLEKQYKEGNLTTTTENGETVYYAETVDLTGSSTSMTYDFSPIASVQTMTFYVPLPVGEYSDFSIKLVFDGHQSSIEKSYSGSVKKISRRTLMMMPALKVENNALVLVDAENTSHVTLLEDGQQLEVNGSDKTITVNVPEGTDATAELNMNINPTDNNSTFTITDGSEDGTASTDSKAVVNVNAPAEVPVRTLNINAPTLTVNLKSGKYYKVEALTANNTLILGSGVGIYELVVKGGNVKLEGDVTLSTPIVVNQDMTLDLGGHTLTADQTGIIVKKGTLTVKNGTLKAEKTGYDAISIQGVSGETVNVNIASDAILTAGDCCIVVPNSNQSTDVNITTAGVLTAKGTYNAIQLNGNASKGNLTVNGGQITSTDADAAGIYFPCNGTLTITKGKITGSTAVYIKSGNLKISGGEFIGNGTKKDYEYYDNGCHTTGDALVIDNCNYPYALGTLSVSGGKFSSTNAKAVGSYCGNGVTEVKTGFITGGTFSDAASFNYLADGADVTLGDNCEISEPIIIPQGVKASVNLGSNVIKAQTDAFIVQGTLGIQANEDAVIHAGIDTQNTGASAVWAYNGGSVYINGGHYIVYEDKDGNRNDCIYAGSNSGNTSGTITINGGTFEYGSMGGTENAKNGNLFLLNCADSQPASGIVVNGGFFMNHVPSLEPNGTDEVTLGTDKKVYNKDTGEEVTAAHSGTITVWYEVK